MKVKKFQAPTMPEVMKKVRKELGSDAVILNSKVVKVGGFLGMFKKNHTEVIAAVDPSSKSSKEEQPSKQSMTMTPTVQRIPEQHSTESSDVLREVRQLRSMIESQGNRPRYLPFFQEIYDHYLDQEIGLSLAQELVDELQEKYSSIQLSSSGETLESLAAEALKNKMDHLPFGHPSFDKQFVHLVGPTGVGKTTTVAKIAADAVLNRRLSVALITTDTYRIGAIDQLRTYAKILDVPLEVAYSLDDYVGARNKFEDYDLVLVDTAGRNFRDPMYVKELKKIIDFNEDTETLLVLSLTAKFQDMKEIYEQFHTVPIRQLIFTKVDETSRLGGAVNMAIHYNLGIAYLTNGQDVPDDIVEPSSEWLVQHIMEVV